ncbi:Hypothetical predicted protein, partial [Marmota monax]
WVSDGTLQLANIIINKVVSTLVKFNRKIYQGYDGIVMKITRDTGTRSRLLLKAERQDEKLQTWKAK